MKDHQLPRITDILNQIFDLPPPSAIGESKKKVMFKPRKSSSASKPHSVALDATKGGTHTDDSHTTFSDDDYEDPDFDADDTVAASATNKRSEDPLRDGPDSKRSGSSGPDPLNTISSASAPASFKRSPKLPAKKRQGWRSHNYVHDIVHFLSIICYPDLILGIMPILSIEQERKSASKSISFHTGSGEFSSLIATISRNQA
ncbi:hypothetical protein N7495_005030 [Penicillium taxi]|uniref:uncharacterized protein n=1 Tax=Penicillium taxi TaxID=168475 RepID=UPI0025455623|nr:uncharacterized protein N7495_005030 [Penicillium taxi]KAJ5893339.1 hypothetical protein N7495_005030 [Penicillium taxi]